MSNIVLDESRLTQILQDQRFLAAFPFMKAAAAALKVKPCRCSRSTTNKARDYGHIKGTIATMSPEKKREFKQLLGASEVTLTYVNSRKLKVELTF